MPAMASTSGNVTTSPAAQTVTTSFLLTNLHCPTCVSTIKAILQESTDGQIRWVSPNIVTSVVTVEHHPAASIRQMQSALEDNGFEVCAIATPSGHVSDLDLGTMQRDHQGASRAGPSKANARSAEPSALSRWILSSRKLAGQPEKVQAHLRNCAHCRGSPEEGCGNNMQQTGVTSHLGLASTRTSTTSDSQPGTLSKSFIAIETSENVPLWRATVAVGGMTCAACSRKVTEQLQKHDWISNVNVSLISNSATVDLIDKDKEADLIDLIEELGYEATLVTIENVNKTKRKRREGSDTWRATLSIGGMTCAACSNKIIEQMKKKEWVKDITVNLISNTATVDFQGYNNASRLVEAIEELGYDAASDTVVSLDDDDEEAPEEQQRTIEIKIDGLYCLHCPARVVQSLAGFRRQLTVVSEPTLQKPIMKITYVPDAPSFTIRQILSAIDASDPDFTASLYHPPTLEERSKMMQRRHYRQILWRFIFSGIIAIPTFVIGIVYMNLVPMSQKHFLMETPGSSRIDRMQIALFVLATPVYFFSADVFHRRAFTEIRTLWRRGSRVPILQRFVRFGSMNTLMSLGTTISYFASVGQMIAIAVDDSRKLDDSLFYFDSVVFLTFFLLLGRLLEALSKSKMGNAVEKLANLRPTRAILVKGHGTEKQQDEVVDTDLLDRGDIVRVPHGSSPPSDGIIVEGNSSFDESSLTGESVPVKKTTGDEVFSGTVNKENSVLVRITGTSGKSLLDQIVEIVREGQTKRAPIEQVADSMTAYFVPCITLAAILTWIGWLCAGYSGGVPTEWLNQTQSGEWVAFAIQFSIAVFVVACPCGLGLAAPTAIYVGSSLAAKHGILAKGGGEAFQLASTVDCVVFDKTGTLTQGGEPSITDSEVYAASDDEEKGILAALKAVEGNSSHPIAKAIVSFCTATGKEELPNVTIDSTQEIPGKGMRAAFKETVAGQPLELIVGNEALMEDFSVQVPEATSQLLQKWKQEAKSVALVAIKKAAAVAETEAAPAPTWSLAAILAISDPIRPEASLVIRALQERGVQVWMLSGDNQITANAVAQQLGIPPEQVIAGVLPTGKAEQITYLQSTLKTGRGKSQESTTQRAKVAMVGDGINDSPALTKADVGIAIGSGSDVAMNSAAFVLMNSDLKAVVRLLDLSKTILRRVRFNFGWAVVYNTIAIPFAAGAFYPIKANGNHIKLDPAWAALAMALSSVSVVVSSLLLKTKIFGYRERKLE